MSCGDIECDTLNSRFGESTLSDFDLPSLEEVGEHDTTSSTATNGEESVARKNATESSVADRRKLLKSTSVGSSSAKTKSSVAGTSFATKSKKRSEPLDIIEQDRIKRKRKAAIGTGVGLLAVVGIVGGLVAFDPFGGEQNGASDTQSTVGAGQVNTNAPIQASKDTSFYQGKGQTGYIYPVKLEDWQSGDYEVGSKKVNEGILRKYSNGEFGQKSRIFPSASTGFTSDVSKEKLPNGTLNPAFTFVTGEDFRIEVGGYIERLINPVLGGWYSLQFSAGKASSATDPTGFVDMFSSSFFEKNAKKPLKDYLPIYADWNQDDYGLGNQLLDSGPRWMGTVKSTKTKLIYDKNTLQYSGTVTANIVYKAWARDQTVLQKEGVLTLNVVTDTSAVAKGANKLKINDASLKVS